MREKSDVWVFGLTVASAATALVSIAASETLLAAACLTWIIFRPRTMVLPRFVAPLAAYMTATVLSLVMSPEPPVGIAAVRKFVLFSMVALTATFVTTSKRAKGAYATLMIVSAAGSLYALSQFSLQYAKYIKSGDLTDDPMVLARATGFVGHWITFSGEQLLVWCAAIPAIILLGYWWIVPLTVISAGIVMSFTRSTWLGAAAGMATVALAMPRKLVITILIPVALIGASASGLISHRLSMSRQQGFAPDSGRIALLKTGIRMTQDHPWFGVGPERIKREFHRYYGASVVPFSAMHLENNFTQIAAERGLICLAAFVWLIVELYYGLLRLRRHRDETVRMSALSGLAAMTGFLLAGLFTYNFGDSEVLLLFLFIVSAPFGLEAASKA